MTGAVTLPLAGVRVIEFCHVAAGPFCGMLLADYGAEVTKVEPLEGDAMRQWPPITHGSNENGFSENFASINRGKRSIALDLKDPASRDLARELVMASDVVIENNRPGAMARLGLGWDWFGPRKPSLIYCSISAFGQDGPRGAEGGFDLTIQAAAGVMSVTGEPEGAPVKAGVPLVDFGAGLYGAFSIAAMVARVRAGGPGGHLDVPMFATTIAMSALQTSEYFGTGRNPRKLGSAHPRNAPYQAFRSQDGWFAIAAGNNKLWQQVCEIAGTPELLTDTRFASPTLRAANQAALRDLLEARFAHHSTDNWLGRFAPAGVPCAPINGYAQALSDPQATHLQLVQPMTLPNGVQTRTVGCPVRFDGEVVALDTRPPAIGEHTDRVIDALRLTSAAPIILQISDGIASIDLNRPQRGNALNIDLVEAVLDAVHSACHDPSVHTLMFAGAGRHFCTGFDLDGLESQSDGDLLLRFARIEALLDAVWRAPVRTVAIAHGRTWGAGADLFAACDLRIAATGASFRFPGAGFGIVLGTRRLAERVGTERARAWVSDGATVEAEQALACGLASRLVDLPQAGGDWRRLACGPAPAIDRDTLAMIRSASRSTGGPGGDMLADADLAALVRSATSSITRSTTTGKAGPGLSERIAAYRDRTRATR
jgi:crotonobetainyl-CoA:carnitine CoA-transferase CaiB-like acyl-CoA transferase/enoyl-CoA hydratase/carnithine racemase